MDFSSLVSLLTSKRDWLKHYYNVTLRLDSPKFEVFEECINDRNNIIQNVNSVNSQINDFVLSLPYSEKSNVSKILAFKHKPFADQYPELTSVVSEIFSVLSNISSQEIIFKHNVEKIRQELLGNMKNANNTKKMINLYNSANVSFNDNNKLDKLR